MEEHKYEEVRCPHCKWLLFKIHRTGVRISTPPIEILCKHCKKLAVFLGMYLDSPIFVEKLLIKQGREIPVKSHKRH